jgi:hypothetical protein
MCEVCTDNLDDLLASVSNQHKGEDRLDVLKELRAKLSDAVLQLKEDIGETAEEDEEGDFFDEEDDK